MTTETRPVRAIAVGDITCHVISDGQAAYPPEFLFANAERDVLDPAIRDRLDEDGNIATPYHCLLLQTPSANVLVDTGLGRHAAAVGAPPGTSQPHWQRPGSHPPTSSSSATPTPTTSAAWSPTASWPSPPPGTSCRASNGTSGPPRTTSRNYPRCSPRPPGPCCRHC
jgi:hypothetical protein